MGSTMLLSGQIKSIAKYVEASKRKQIFFTSLCQYHLMADGQPS